MYPNSNSSSGSQRDPNHAINGSSNTTGGGGLGLARYRSAPVSLTTTVDSVIDAQGQNTVGNHMVAGGGTPTRYFSPTDTTSSQLSSSVSTRDRLQTTSFRLNEFASAFNGLKGNTTTQTTPSPLFRHGSSPAGFLNTLTSSTPTESDIANSLMFSSSSSHNKRTKMDMNGLNIMESELNFGLSESALEAAAMEKMMDLPHDSVACKIRAKRGCATHPRSIAERERRTRISGKLKKLQDLVPNMDKNLNHELENCSCGCKPR
ncbi:Myc-type, basic helix-loop-helix (bHLH) domain-containing protein [Cynara cardunculus var. scolymus]|uniref:Myc-type, basic helix-loop-helix (BHLH) domain-containing protein n=1 Tax=Cynara cardunculus var. scolymus TaxID=59895 RepID=A0A118JTR7_CYNCS|nr:Myc-type, basic helix-loop-helix (bHLH) domain-containing protein [Cynara cardunculus var. scolymus]